MGDTSSAPTDTIASSSSATPAATFAHVDEATADADTRQRADLDVTEAVADMHGGGEAGVGRLTVAAEDGLQAAGVAEVAVLYAVEARLVEQSLGPVDPATAPRQLTAVQQPEGDPERAPRRSGDIAPRRVRVVGGGPFLVALVAPTAQIRGGREPLEFVRLDRFDVSRAPSLPQDQNASLPAGAVQTIHISAMRSPSNR